MNIQVCSNRKLLELHTPTGQTSMLSCSQFGVVPVSILRYFCGYTNLVHMCIVAPIIMGGGIHRCRRSITTFTVHFGDGAMFAFSFSLGSVALTVTISHLCNCFVLLTLKQFAQGVDRRADMCVCVTHDFFCMLRCSFLVRTEKGC